MDHSHNNAVNDTMVNSLWPNNIGHTSEVAQSFVLSDDHDSLLHILKTVNIGSATSRPEYCVVYRSTTAVGSDGKVNLERASVRLQGVVRHVEIRPYGNWKRYVFSL